MRNKTTSDNELNLKQKIVAISLLVALTGWTVPAKTASKTKPLVFSQQNKQIQLQKESVIYKTDALSIRPSQVNAPIQPHAKKLDTARPITSPKAGIQNRRDYPVPTADKEAVKALILKYSQQYGIDSAVPLCIAYHESGFNSSSKNKSSSASGVFQYLAGTWRGTDEGKAGLSVFDADSNVKAAVKYMATRKSTQPWEVRNKCPHL